MEDIQEIPHLCLRNTRPRLQPLMRVGKIDSPALNPLSFSTLPVSAQPCLVSGTIGLLSVSLSVVDCLVWGERPLEAERKCALAGSVQPGHTLWVHSYVTLCFISIFSFPTKLRVPNATFYNIISALDGMRRPSRLRPLAFRFSACESPSLDDGCLRDTESTWDLVSISTREHVGKRLTSRC